MFILHSQARCILHKKMELLSHYSAICIFFSGTTLGLQPASLQQLGSWRAQWFAQPSFVGKVWRSLGFAPWVAEILQKYITHAYWQPWSLDADCKFKYPYCILLRGLLGTLRLVKSFWLTYQRHVETRWVRISPPTELSILLWQNKGCSPGYRGFDPWKCSSNWWIWFIVQNIFKVIWCNMYYCITVIYIYIWTYLVWDMSEKIWLEWTPLRRKHHVYCRSRSNLVLRPKPWKLQWRCQETKKQHIVELFLGLKRSQRVRRRCKKEGNPQTFQMTRRCQGQLSQCGTVWPRGGRREELQQPGVC